ncbi:MAG: hypothetical protein PSV26_17390 [Polaromonas sp.]|uniref:hypothetical protein n=1 Tax=Polaromonas sp. TaxID=1869339 RepID=UPI0024896847|nr:hypothetical protein [Polaromonas sp.]MDI1239260.1 hypothetical protein [Polaromonas sp.]
MTCHLVDRDLDLSALDAQFKNDEMGASAYDPRVMLKIVFSAVALVYLNSVAWHTSLAFAFSQKAVQRAYLRNFARLTKVSGAVVGAFGMRLIVGTLQELRTRMP